MNGGDEEKKIDQRTVLHKWRRWEEKLDQRTVPIFRPFLTH